MSRTSPLLNPFALWTDLGLRTAEMMLSSAQVIQHRTQRMAQATIPPSAKDSAEFALMGREKMDAVTESMQAATLQMMTLNPFTAATAWAEMMAVQADLLSLATSSGLPTAMARHARLGRSMRKAAHTASTFSDHAANTALKALKPIHSRATANAKRLKKS